LRYSRISLIRDVTVVSAGRKRQILWSPRSQWLKGLHKNPKAELASMLPGFRFLFAAIVLSMSILVFGLGAAALLRAAHEQFSSIPSRRGPPETMFVQRNDAAAATLAALRVEPPAEERKAPDDIPPAAAPTEQTAIVSTQAEQERTAPLEPDDTLLMEMTASAIPESQPHDATSPALADTPASTDETKRVANSEAPPSKEVGPVASEPTGASPAADASASTKIAALGGPAVAIEAQPAPKAAGAKPDSDATKKRLQAKHDKERRRIAQRARLARQAAQQPVDPFGLPTAAVRSH
jgi:hypothetical protein